MEEIILMGIEAGTALLPFSAALLFCRRAYGRKGMAVSAGRMAGMTVFAVYIIGVFFVTGAGTLYDALRYGLEWRQGQVSFVPFANEIDSMAYLLNILLLLPFGFLLPALWGQSAGFWKVVFRGFASPCWLN